VWRLQKDARQMWCEIRNDDSVGAGWDVRLHGDDGLIVSRRADRTGRAVHRDGHQTGPITVRLDRMMAWAIAKMRFGLSILLVLIVGSGASAKAARLQTKSGMSDSERVAALQLSKMCADEGQKYAALSAPKEKPALYTVQTHYNHVLSRCLVEITESNVETSTGVQTLSIGVYDPIEYVRFAHFATLTKGADTVVLMCETRDAAGNLIPCVSDLHLVEIATSIFLPYRSRLMNQ
jgi:hypothetical protein